MKAELPTNVRAAIESCGAAVISVTANKYSWWLVDVRLAGDVEITLRKSRTESHMRRWAVVQFSNSLPREKAEEIDAAIAVALDPTRSMHCN